MHRMAVVLTALGLTLASVGQTQAAFISGAVASGDLTTVIVGGTVVDFESSTDHEFTSEIISGVQFSGVDGNLRIGSYYAGQYNNHGTHYLDNNGLSTNSFRIDLTTGPVSDVAFLFGASDYLWTLSAYNSSGTLLENHDLTPLTLDTNSGNYFGFSRGSADISYLTITNISGSNDWIFVDNLTFKGEENTVATPEPGSLTLIGLAAACFAGYAGWRRKKKSAAVSEVESSVS